MIHKMLQAREKIYSLFIYLIVFLSTIYPYSDNDWGWHYRYGEYFFKHGHFLDHDIFTWTMNGYQWINPSLLFDPILYVLSNTIGFLGLSILGGLVLVVSFYLLISPFKLDFWKKAILGTIFILLTHEGISEGFRSQSLSVLLFSILMWILIRSRENLKFLFLLPFLFLIWANIHGDFISAYGVMGIFMGTYFLTDFFKEKRFPKKLFTYYFSFSAASFLIAFINPHGYKIYFEFIRYFGNPFLKNILEWQPIYKDCSSCHTYGFSLYIIVLIISIIYLIRKKDYRALPFIGVIGVMLWPTIDTRRLTSVFAAATIPLLGLMLSQIKINLSKYKSLDYITLIFIITALCYNLFTRFPASQIYHYTESSYCQFSTKCTSELTNYLTKNPPRGRGFNWYDIGGYLIGKGVPAKLFVDGRMGLWQTDSGFFPFAEYVKMYYWEDYNLFNKYKFDWLLIQNDSNIAKKIYNTRELGLWDIKYQKGNILYMTRRK